MKEGIIAIHWSQADGVTKTQSFNADNIPFTVKKMIAESFLREIGIEISIDKVEK